LNTELLSEIGKVEVQAHYHHASASAVLVTVSSMVMGALRTK